MTERRAVHIAARVGRRCSDRPPGSADNPRPGRRSAAPNRDRAATRAIRSCADRGVVFDVVGDQVAVADLQIGAAGGQGPEMLARTSRTAERNPAGCSPGSIAGTASRIPALRRRCAPARTRPATPAFSRAADLRYGKPTTAALFRLSSIWLYSRLRSMNHRIEIALLQQRAAPAAPYSTAPSPG